MVAFGISQFSVAQVNNLSGCQNYREAELQGTGTNTGYGITDYGNGTY